MAGGYPASLTRKPGRARQWHRQYLCSIIERGVQDVAQVRNAHELARLLDLLALRSANLKKNTEVKVYAKLPGWFTVPTCLPIP